MPGTPAPRDESPEDPIERVFNPDCRVSPSLCYVDPHSEHNPAETAEIVVFEGPEHLGKTQKLLHWSMGNAVGQHTASVKWFKCMQGTTADDICRDLAPRQPNQSKGLTSHQCWRSAADALHNEGAHTLAIQNVHYLKPEDLNALLAATEILKDQSITLAVESREPLAINPLVGLGLRRRSFVPWSATPLATSLDKGASQLQFTFHEQATAAFTKYCVGDPRALQRLARDFTFKKLGNRPAPAAASHDDRPEIGYEPTTDADIASVASQYFYPDVAADPTKVVKAEVDVIRACHKQAETWWREDGRAKEWREFGSELLIYIYEDSINWFANEQNGAHSQSLPCVAKSDFVAKLERLSESPCPVPYRGGVKRFLDAVSEWDQQEWFRLTGGYVWIDDAAHDWVLHLTRSAFRFFLVRAGADDLAHVMQEVTNLSGSQLKHGLEAVSQ